MQAGRGGGGQPSRQKQKKQGDTASNPPAFASFSHLCVLLCVFEAFLLSFLPLTCICRAVLPDPQKTRRTTCSPPLWEATHSLTRLLTRHSFSSL